jgi:hypothetical protein
MLLDLKTPSQREIVRESAPSRVLAIIAADRL